MASAWHWRRTLAFRVALARASIAPVLGSGAW